MEFNHILAAVPEGEHFDASAINEGVWISTGHLGNIEALLENANVLVNQANEQLQTAAANIEEANTKVETATTTIAEKDAEIERLNAEIASLKAAPAKEITQTVKEGDDKEEKKEFVSEVTKEAQRLRALRNKK